MRSLRQKMFCGRTERVAEFDQAIEPRDALPPASAGNASASGVVNVQLAQRIHEECGAAAHLVAQQSHARARLVERFDDDVFQFIAQKLFDGAFVLFLHFGVIGQQADGAEAAAMSRRARRSR